MLTSLLQACCEHILLTITVSCEIFTVEDDLVHTQTTYKILCLTKRI
jgi:hypothetical protein